MRTAENVGGVGDEWETNLGDDSVELASLVAEPAFSSCELTEVARGHRTDVIVELEDNSPHGLGVDFNVKLLAKQH